MIFEKIEKIIKFNVKIKCINCNKQIPGGIKSSKHYFNTNKFNKELNKFQKIYLLAFVEIKKELIIKLKIHRQLQ